MDLSTVIKKTEDLGITILFCNMPKTKGRYDNTLEKPCIYFYLVLFFLFFLI